MKEKHQMICIVSRYKFTFIALSRRFLKTISFDTPAIVSHHMHIPFSLIAFFHDFQILMKSFALLITNSTTVFWEVGNVENVV